MDGRRRIQKCQLLVEEEGYRGDNYWWRKEIQRCHLEMEEEGIQKVPSGEKEVPNEDAKRRMEGRR